MLNVSTEEAMNVLNGETNLFGIVNRIREGRSKNIIVLTGAGISTNSGIADFRSEKGIYKNKELKEKYNTRNSQLFTLSSFFEDRETFFKVIKDMFLPAIKGIIKPTDAHYFISLLDKKGLLVRNYTQNIDALEHQAGISKEKIIESHGSLKRAICINCKLECRDYDKYWNDIENDILPLCKECGGQLKPDCVLFQEQLPTNFFMNIYEDFLRCDLLIVMGTSLQVYPFASLVNSVNFHVPRLLFNKEPVAVFTKGMKHEINDNGDLIDKDNGLEGTYRDIAVLGDIDQGIRKLIEQLGWEEDFNNIKNQH